MKDIPARDIRLPVAARLPRAPMGVIDSYLAARENILGIIPDGALDLPMLSGRTGPQRWHMVMGPAGIRQVLLERVEHYPKSEATKSILRPAIGESLFVAEGDHWRWQRRAAAPAFAARNVEALTPVMTRAAEAAADRIAKVAGRRAINAVDEMVGATFDIIADITLSDPDGMDRAAVGASLDAYIDRAARVSVLDVLGAPGWMPRPGRQAAVRDLAQMQGEMDRAIVRRQASGPSLVPDLMDLLMGARDPETGREMTPAELRENLLTFIVAGHETTALTLAWALYLCAFDQSEQDKARAEAQTVLGRRAATAADVPRLTAVRHVVEESLRLYPPGGFLSRTAQAPDRLAGATIRPGDTVMIPVYAVHRHRLLWDAPDAFRPDRWHDRGAIDRYQYLPFGDGPRICIGARLAMQEAVVILATLLARFRFTAIPGRDPRPVMILTLRPEGGVWLQVEPL
ncbi:cytochrome P450 [Roseicyclus mahoneyensis]|uniref:Cytochrome P450 n=1 Tax=Roseicyclus mahoneyensis TaxID=164332 RepID=A0A316GJW7_9RHOB|nr:cytochrome P450 [Roseicyclus mahoneyensis]PWK60294.1 cytochrome P450 [Roseicyclus mahoneyensis]